MNVKRKLIMLERCFVRTEEMCTHCPDSAGVCRCESCLLFMRNEGWRYDRSPGHCAECMGTGWELKFRSVPLDENGAPMKQTRRDVAIDEDGNLVRVVGQPHARPKERTSSKRPVRKPSGNQVMTKSDWKKRGK